MTKKIELKNISKSFGENKVLKSINLGVANQESLVILGGSGSGKSVMIKTILGIEEPDGGEILIDGINILAVDAKEKRKIRTQIGVLFQSPALFDSMSIFENVAFGLHGKNKAEITEIVHKEIANVGLKEDVLSLFPNDLSGGMQKRVSLARTLAPSPKIIIFDEPTTGLDPISSQMITDLIIDNMKKIKATSITISHDIKSAKQIADKIALLYNGEIIWHDISDNLEKTNNEYVKNFVQGCIGKQ